MQTASNSNMEDVLNKSRVTNGPNEKWAFKSKEKPSSIPKNIAHKKEFSMTGNFQGSPKVDSQDKLKAVAALHNSEYGTFAKDKPLVHSELSDDQ